MTEHSTAELKKQWEAAKDRAKQAANAAVEAERRFKNSILDDTGFRGKKCLGKRWGKEFVFVPYAVVGWRLDELEGPLVKKDGTEGQRTVRSYIGDIALIEE